MVREEGKKKTDLSVRHRSDVGRSGFPNDAILLATRLLYPSPAAGRAHASTLARTQRQPQQQQSFHTLQPGTNSGSRHLTRLHPGNTAAKICRYSYVIYRIIMERYNGIKTKCIFVTRISAVFLIQPDLFFRNYS